MYKILFVCHGNICRSPMAEFVFKDIVKKNGSQNDFDISSAAMTSEELGNPVYPPVRALLNKKGISTEGKTAQKIKIKDFEDFDYIIYMDSENREDIFYLIGAKTVRAKVRSLLSFANINRDVSDPWFTRDFETCYSDILLGCKALYDCLKR